MERGGSENFLDYRKLNTLRSPKPAGLQVSFDIPPGQVPKSKALSCLIVHATNGGVWGIDVSYQKCSFVTFELWPLSRCPGSSPVNHSLIPDKPIMTQILKGKHRLLLPFWEDAEDFGDPGLYLSYQYGLRSDISPAHAPSSYVSLLHYQRVCHLSTP